MHESGIVIVGSGMAGYALAREFRKLDSATPVEIVTADDGAVYSKPMLSNALAQGKTPDTLVQKEALRAADDFGIAVRTRTHVAGIDRAGKHISLNNGEHVPYGKLVLAVGARPRPYPLDGGGATRIETVNSLDDYRRWRRGIGPGTRVLLLGAGLIGAEFANDLAAAGCDVTAVDPMPWPLGRLLPEQAGHALREALEGAGVRFHLGRMVKSIAPSGGGWEALLDDGTPVGFDRVLSAIGLVPRTELAESARLAVGVGIRVDAVLTTSDPEIFAIGDCAETDAGILPYVLPLMAEARALARTLAGSPTPLCLPALPVVVKTPALPIAICPPRPGAEGQWLVSGNERDLHAVYRTPEGIDLGFALTGKESSARQSLAKEMPALLAA
jgi:rubredoxin-NAD+ reductase